MVFVVAEPEVHQALAAQAEFEVHPGLFVSFGQFMRALQTRQIPVDYSPSVVVFSDTVQADGVELEDFAANMRRAGVLIAWSPPRSVPDGLVVVEPPLTPNVLRHALGRRLNHDYGPLPNGDHEMFVVGHQEPTAAAFEPHPAVSSNGSRSRTDHNELGLAPLPTLDRAHAPPGRPTGPAVNRPPDAARRSAPSPVDTPYNGTQIPTAPGGPHHPAFAPTPQPSHPPPPPPIPLDRSIVAPPPAPRPAATPPIAATAVDPTPPPPPTAPAEIPDHTALRRAEPRPRRESTVIGVWSGKGGVGKTNIAINLAARLAALTDLDVCIIDLDLSKGGNISVALNRWTPTVLELINQPNLTPQTLDMLYREPSTGFAAVFAPVTPDEAADATLLSPATYDRVLAAVRHRFDVVILDCGTSVTDRINHAFAFPRSDVLLAVVDNDKSAMFDVQRGLDSMLRAAVNGRGGIGLTQDQIAVVFNDMVDDVEITEHDMRKVLQRPYPILARFEHDARLWRGSLNVRRFVSLIGDPTVQRGFDDILNAVIPGLELEPIQEPDRQPGRGRRERTSLIKRLIGR